MAYAPINVDAYTNAYSGAIAGMAVSGWITDPTAADYSNVATIAGAFAKAFDLVWNSATALNWLQIQAIQSVCQEQFRGHAPGSLDNTTFVQASNWAVAAAACAALVLEGDAFVGSEGITPNTPGGGSTPLSNVFWVDSGAAAEGNGSISSPFKTMTNALIVQPNNGVFLLTGDFSAESPLNIPGTVKVQLIGLSEPGDGTAFNGINVKIPGIIQATGGEQGSLVLQNLECTGNLDIGLSVVCIDCIGVFVEGQSTDLGTVEIRGGTCVGAICSSLISLTGVTIGSGATFNLQNPTTRIIDCTFAGVAADITFAGAAGIVWYDLPTLQAAGTTAGLATVTNGQLQLMGIVRPRSFEGQLTALDIPANTSDNTTATTLTGTFPYAGDEVVSVIAVCQYKGTTPAAYLEVLGQLQASIDGGGSWNNIGFARRVSQVVNNNPTWFQMTLPAVVLAGAATADIQIRLQLTNAAASGTAMESIDVALVSSTASF